jgi:F-type H+-transporting ATPase subunit epsilon
VSSFPWAIRTPDGTPSAGECEMLVAPTTRGELGVLAGHADLVACLVPGELRVTSAGAVRTYPVGLGLIEIREGRVSLFLASALPKH